ncbi:MAG: TetR/AcrR family transcriptional regulator [Propionibacteriaceae bacterium]
MEGESPPAPKRPLRRDAVENRERVLTAAAAAILREGENVPLATIAADAGVGVGTLYRRYANREELFSDLQLRAYRMVITALRDADAQGDSGLHGVQLFLEQTVRHRSQLILPLHGAPELATPEAAALRAELGQAMAALLGRGKADGSVRSDSEPFDVVVFGSMLAQGLSGINDWEAVTQGQIRLFLAGIAGPAGART